MTCLCPKCNAEQAEIEMTEVDIGVGIQQHIYGYDCPTCGQLSVCGSCGGLENIHAAWCAECGGN